MIVLGIIGIVVSVPLLISGIAIAALFGPDGSLASGGERIETPTRALVSAVAEISGDTPVDRDLFGVRLELKLRSAEEGALFVGIGPAADVTRYLEGVNVERIDEVDFAPFRYRKSELAGTRTPTPPGAETFWVARSEGTGVQTISWRVRTGTYQVVVMNADASAGVDVTGSIGIKIPWIFWLAIGLLVVGGLLLVGGILFVVFGAKRRPLPPGQQPPYGGTPVGVTYPAGPPPYAQPVPAGLPPLPPLPTGLAPGSPLPPPPPPG